MPPVNQRTKTGRGRMKSYGIMLAIVVAIIWMLAAEQVALLYVIATLGLTILLLLVAFSNLGEKPLE
jgi:hypothetical protein